MEKEKFDPLNCDGQEQMSFVGWLSDEYPDFWDKVVEEYNKMLEETD